MTNPKESKNKIDNEEESYINHLLIKLFADIEDLWKTNRALAESYYVRLYELNKGRDVLR